MVLSVLMMGCASLRGSKDQKSVNQHDEYDDAVKVRSLKNSHFNENSEARKKSRVNSKIDKEEMIENISIVEKKANVISLESHGSKVIIGKKSSELKKSSVKKAGKQFKVSAKLSKNMAASAASKEVEKIKVAESGAIVAPLKEKKSYNKAENLTNNKKLPSLEDSEGFDGRRPVNDPLRVGEETVISLSYFNVEAGRLTLSTKPFKEVNGKKAYHLHYKVKTSRLFSVFYRVNDSAETFVDYEKWRPISYEIHVNQSKQVREITSFFDWKKMMAFYHDRKKKKDNTLKVSKVDWKIFPWSQNVFSVAFYLRTHTLKVGKTLKVRVAHEGKNMIMSAKVLRKEKIKTKVGSMDAFVVQPIFTVDGMFKPTGKNLIWLSADDRKFILRVESKVNMGTFVGQVESIKR